MGTPVQIFLVYLKSLFLVVASILVGALLMSRAYIFYESYILLTLERSEEAWLRVRCGEPDFYTNMRQHTDLCAKVEQKARTSIMLRSLNMMIMSTNLCSSSRTCMDYVQEMVVKGLAWPLAAVLCVMLITIPSLVVRMARKAMWKAFDRRARITPATIGGVPGGLSYFRQDRRIMCARQEDAELSEEGDQEASVLVQMSPFYSASSQYEEDENNNNHCSDNQNIIISSLNNLINKNNAQKRFDLNCKIDNEEENIIVDNGGDDDGDRDGFSSRVTAGRCLQKKTDYINFNNTNNNNKSRRFPFQFNQFV